MRIIDVLRQDDGDGSEVDAAKRTSSLDLAASPPPSTTAASSSSEASSSASAAASSSYPRSLISRLLLPLLRPSPGGGGGGCRGERSCLWHRKKKSKKGKHEVEGEEGCGTAMTIREERSCRARDEEERSAQLSIPSGEKPKDASFSLGMGAGLILLLARRATEFDKIMEMQRQMETLVKEIKDVVQRKGNAPGFTDSSNNVGSSTSDCCGDMNTSRTPSSENFTTLDREGAVPAMVFDGLSNYDTSFENRSCPKLDKLAAELEIELKRLQINLEGEDLEVLPGLHDVEPTRGENSDPSESFTMSFGDDEECNEDHKSETCGVPPCELERRLHELLETRQRERIAELESALEFTKRKLQEKETEASWWRDTAMHATGHTLSE